MDNWRRWSRLGAINVTPEIEATENHANGGGPCLVVLPIEDDIGLLKEGSRNGRGRHRTKLGLPEAVEERARAAGGSDVADRDRRESTEAGGVADEEDRKPRDVEEAGGVAKEEDRKPRDVEEAGALEGAKTLTLNLALIPC